MRRSEEFPLKGRKKTPTDHKNTNLGDRDGKDRKRSTWGHCPCRYATRLYSHGLGTPSFSTTPSFLKCLSIFWQMLQMRSFPIRRFLALEGSQLLTGDEEHNRRLPDGQPATPPRLPAGFASAYAGFNTQTRSPSRAGVGGGGAAKPLQPLRGRLRDASPPPPQPAALPKRHSGPPRQRSPTASPQ